MEKKRVTVMVAGQRFTILTEDSEKYVIDIAAKIDARISSMTMTNMSRERAAVLTALDFADDNEKIKSETAQIREQIKDYIENLSRLNAEVDTLRAENEKLQEKAGTDADDKALIAALQEEIAALKEQLSKAEEKPAVTEHTAIAEEVPPVPAQSREEERVTQDKPKEELYFGVPLESAVRPQKKPRHEHKHENPYRQQFLNKQNNAGAQKGYIPKRQYSLFDDEE